MMEDGVNVRFHYFQGQKPVHGLLGFEGLTERTGSGKREPLTSLLLNCRHEGQAMGQGTGRPLVRWWENNWGEPRQKEEKRKRQRNWNWGERKTHLHLADSTSQRERGSG